MAGTKRRLYIIPIYDTPMNSWYPKEDKVLVFKERPIYDEKYDDFDNLDATTEHDRSEFEEFLGLSIPKEDVAKILVVDISRRKDYFFYKVNRVAELKEFIRG